jgi:hypothetical protein
MEAAARITFLSPFSPESSETGTDDKREKNKNSKKKKSRVTLRLTFPVVWISGRRRKNKNPGKFFLDIVDIRVLYSAQ